MHPALTLCVMKMSKTCHFLEIGQANGGSTEATKLRVTGAVGVGVALTLGFEQRREGNGFVAGTTLESPANRRDHSRRKFARSCFPASVSTDSGWNCTPSTFISLWRRPMMIPFGELAEISRQSGRDERSTISEW